MKQSNDLEITPRSSLSLSLSLSLIPGRGDGSPPRSSPGSSIGVLGRFDSGDLAILTYLLTYLRVYSLKAQPTAANSKRLLS